MKNDRCLKLVLCAVLIATCALSGLQALAECTGKKVEPLPPTLDVSNLTDCMFPAAFTSADVALNDDGALVIHMTVYDTQYFDLADVAQLAVGDTIVIDGAEQKVAAIERDEYGRVLLNGGNDADGYTLATDEDGVYYVTDFDDMRHYRALGEATLPVAQEFQLEDSSDLENPEKLLLAGDLLTDIAPADESYTPGGTTVTVEGGFITNIKVVYVP